jgi:hypothetical protein
MRRSGLYEPRGMSGFQSLELSHRSVTGHPCGSRWFPRRRVTSARGASFTTSRSARVPASTGPWSRAGLRRSRASRQAASTPSSGLGFRRSSHHPASTARSPAWRCRAWAARAAGVGESAWSMRPSYRRRGVRLHVSTPPHTAVDPGGCSGPEVCLPVSWRDAVSPSPSGTASPGAPPGMREKTVLSQVFLWDVFGV